MDEGNGPRASLPTAALTRGIRGPSTGNARRRSAYNSPHPHLHLQGHLRRRGLRVQREHDQREHGSVKSDLEKNMASAMKMASKKNSLLLILNY